MVRAPVPWADEALIRRAAKRRRGARIASERAAVRWELPPYASLCSGGLRGRDAVRVLSPRRRVRVQRSAAPFRSGRRACPRARRARRAAGLPARAAAHVPRRARGRFDRLPLALGKRRRPSHRSGADRRRGRQRGRESCRGALSYGEGAAPPDAVRADATLSGAGRAHGDGELPAVHGHAHVQQPRYGEVLCHVRARYVRRAARMALPGGERVAAGSAGRVY